MTVTIRIQYKGEGARKLAAEEHSKDREAESRYVEDMNRALNLFAIPAPPDSSKAIWKSGFVLCNYNTTRDTPLFDRIYRGAFRAQSIACKNTLEGLSISYIHLFENSKPIFFGKQAQQRSLSPTARTQTLRQKSPSSPPYRHKTWSRPLGPERSAPELSGGPQRSPTGYKDYHMRSPEKSENIKQEPCDSVLHSKTPREGQNANETLKRLAGSQSLLALLGQSHQSSLPLGSDPPVRQEVVSQKRVEPPRAPRSLLASASSADSVTDSFGKRPQSPSRASPFHQRENRFLRPVPLEDRIKSEYRHSSVTNGGYSRHKERSVSPETGRSSHREPPRPAEYDEDPKHSVNGSSNNHHFTYKPWHTRYKSPPRVQKYSLSSDNLDTAPGWSRSSKRPLSPARAPGRSASPPHKRRYSINSHGAPSQLSPMRTDTTSRPTSSGAGHLFSNGSQPLGRSPTSIASTPTQQLTPNSNGIMAEDPSSRAQRVQTLNRELWDLRRQTTALKAREESILVELRALRVSVPEMPESTTAPAPKTTVSEDKLRLMEAEVHSLRQRLQSETVRRQLVEEACENERRRRKHAEDLLDDARRDSGAPLVVPAMMDAFERIAQLTGEALMSATD